MTTTWDDRGVPTIDADTEHDACHGFGYAQGVAQAGEVLTLYGIARGRAAAMWGQQYTTADVEHAQLGLNAHVDQWLSGQESQTLDRIASFCDGFNAACDDDERRGAGRRDVLPVVPRDVIAHTMKVFLAFARFWDQGLAFAPSPGGLLGGGSSAWAISAGRSAHGHAMLLANPHIPWIGPFQLFEARTVSPGRSCHGVTPIGFPWQSFAYNHHVGWTHTVNPIPQLWVYELDLTDDGYLFDGERMALEHREHIVDVLGGDPVHVVERNSVHGPVITAPDGAQVAIRVAGVLHHPAVTALEGWWQMSLAGTVAELLDAQDRWPLPMFNIVAADDSGSVAAAFCGTTPHRPGGTFDDSQSRLPGDDPAQVWNRVNPPSSLPRVIDPACGWVQNVNETPWWFCDPPLDPAHYPDGIAPRPDQVRDIRSPLSRTWLTERDKISADDLLQLKWRTRVGLADVVLDDLLAAAAPHADLARATEVLAAWDRHCDPGSRGYPLFHLWAHHHLPLSDLYMDGRHLTPPKMAGALPTGLENTEDAAASLRHAATTLTSRGLDIDVAYGEFGRVGTGESELPASGGPSYLGIFKCLELTPTTERWRGIGGDTWIALIHFAPAGPQTAAALVNGNITEATGPRHWSQLTSFAAASLPSTVDLDPSQPRGDL